MTRLIIFLLFPMCLISYSARAQCTKDTDCKGNRICKQGACVESSTPLQALSPVSQVNPNALEQSSARGAAITGFILAGVTLGLALGSEFTKADQVPSLPLGGVATATIAIGVPIIASSGTSLRYSAGVNGNLALRITGWVAYGITLLDAAALIGLGIAEITPADFLIASTGILGATSFVLIAADNLKTYSEAEQKLNENPGGLSLALPMISPVLTPEQGTTGASLVLTGRF